MVDATQEPSISHPGLARVARWSLGLVLAAWLLFGLTWGALHWLIVPRIGEFRPLLEAQATRLLGVQVRIGAVAAHSTGMIPSFELSDIQLFDPQGRAALRLPRVLVALSPRSLWFLGFEQLYVDHPELDIRRGVDGKILIAGLDFSKNSQSDNQAADWLFSQIEFAIHDGTIRWTDELRATPTLELKRLDLVLRNRGRRHDMRVDATPPPQWGERFSLRGMFQQPLLSLGKGRWQDWEGQLYAAFTRVDLSELRRYADLGVDLRQGHGALTVWADVSQGRVLGGAADVALGAVNVTLGNDLQPLELKLVRGRVAGKVLAAGFEFSTQALQFDTADGLHWPGGNVSVNYLGAEGKVAARGELRADKLDLHALAQIADRLPFDASTRTRLRSHAPKGLVESLHARWQGHLDSLRQFEVKGAVSQLELAPTDGLPGVRGAAIEFDANQAGGRASVMLQPGALHLPGVFDEPTVALTQLSTDVRWQIDGERIAVQMPNLKFSNADAQGEAQLKWETSDPTKSGARTRFPGLLDLQGTLSRADGTRVHRYLPSLIGREVRDYVRDAVQSGTASAVKFKLRGDLHDMPFHDPKQGEFRISADVRNAGFAYVPHSVQAKDELPWPALTQLSGELVFERAQMQIRGAKARIGAGALLQITRAEALIPDLAHAVVVVNAEARGALAEGVGIVNGSPLGGMIGHALSRSSVAGAAEYKLKLTLPIANLEKSLVQGNVSLNGNDIQMTPDTPRLTRARGLVRFSESEFSIVGAQAQMLGGEVRLEGGSTSAATLGAARTAPSVLIRANGRASAEGLRQGKELGFVARLAQRASGAAAYSAVLGFRRGEPELQVSSNLQGLALNLPAPFVKEAEAVLPFKLETALLRESLQPAPLGGARLRDQMTLEFGRLASFVYLRDVSGPEPRVMRGSVAIGLSPQESAPLPDEGVAANISLNSVDMDSWGAILSETANTSLTDTQSNNAALGYLPTSMAVRASELIFGGRKLHDVLIGGSREGLQWRANLSARELNGYLEYRQASGSGTGRVYARLAKLIVAPSVVSEVEALLNEQPASIPALDIVVEDFELRGKRLGRLEVEAINRSAAAVAREGGVREWRLNKLNLVTPEATLTASGNWASLNAQSGAPVASALALRGVPERRRTVMNFKLDIADSGELLTRLGMKDVVRKGRGKMEGQVAWQGSPFSLDYPSMTGAFKVNVESGQFLKADPGLTRLIGVLNLQALPRRLTLDFRDVFSEGFAFDFLRGDVIIEHGIAKTNNLQMKGVNAAALMEGQADIAKETQDLKVVVIPELNAGTASLIAGVINPVIGISTFLAQLLLRRPLGEAATQEYHVDGSWADPKITQVPHMAADDGKPEAPASAPKASAR